MTDKRDALPWEKGQLRREAAEWFVLMRGPEAEQHRAAFAAWLDRGGLHRSAYNRVANLFGSAKGINWEALPPARPVRATVRRTVFFAAGSIMVAAFVMWRLLAGPFATILPQAGKLVVHETADMPVTQFASRMGEIRRVRLPDGSWLTLDTDTLVTTGFDRDERELRIEHGRARFEVAHERRPFIVDAGAGEVVAHGTVFDVTLEDDRQVHVALFRGAVDVKTAELSGPRPFSALVHLLPGEGASYAGNWTGHNPPIMTSGARDFGWPTGNIDLPEASLAEVVAMANRYSSMKIRLAGPGVSDIRVSGTFRVDDPRRLASALGRLLHLAVREDRHEIVLSDA